MNLQLVPLMTKRRTIMLNDMWVALVVGGEAVLPCKYVRQASLDFIVVCWQPVTV